ISPYWARIGFDGQANRLGWTAENLEWIFNHPETVENILKDAKDIRDRFKYIIFCGMGGSGLSVQVVKTTFGEKELKLYSLRTTDPAVIADILEDITDVEGSLEVGLNKALVIAISKSGKTQETVSHKKYFEGLFAKLSIDIKEHMWVITDKGSPMDTGGYLQREIQLNGKGDIGGRFTSPATVIFLLPLALVAPEKVWLILKQAKEMNAVKNVEQDIFLRLAAYLYYMAAKQGKDKITMFMPGALKEFPLWAEQLFEESLGKDGKGVTLFYGEEITVQDLKPANKNDRVFFRINLGEERVNRELWDYLLANGYPVFEINIENIDSIGGLMLGLERTVAAIAYLWDICFVDQPAVEGYKKATAEVMANLKPGEKVEVSREWRFAEFKGLKLYFSPLFDTGVVSEDELRIEVKKLGGEFSDACCVYAAIINILSRKPGFEAVELTSYGRMRSGLFKIMQETRTNIFTQLFKMPSKLGEGPDKNHSYQQNIEDGKNMFFSTYIMPLDMEQPQALEYDDNLIKAQAIGTVISMVRKLRKVVLITVYADNDSEQEENIREFFARAGRYSDASSHYIKTLKMKDWGLRETGVEPLPIPESDRREKNSQKGSASLFFLDFLMRQKRIYRIDLGDVIITSQGLQDITVLDKLPFYYRERFLQIINFVAHCIDGPPLRLNILIEPASKNNPFIWYALGENLIHIQASILTDAIPLHYAYFASRREFIQRAYKWEMEKAFLEDLDATVGYETGLFKFLFFILKKTLSRVIENEKREMDAYYKNGLSASSKKSGNLSEERLRGIIEQDPLPKAL
ncbi:MAG: hypothetical protein NT033_09685, partial [Candidatus Omnitrophica bacterium]|nr:hypothetical protein [Candidatus Omnitrophota bacterium]